MTFINIFRVFGVNSQSVEPGVEEMADIMSLNRTGVVLVANTSAHRPLDEAMMAAGSTGGKTLVFCGHSLGVSPRVSYCLVILLRAKWW